MLQRDAEEHKTDEYLRENPDGEADQASGPITRYPPTRSGRSSWPAGARICRERG